MGDAGPNFSDEAEYRVLDDTGPAKYEILEQPLGTTTHVRIITIGAGASGLNVIRTLRKHLQNFEHVVYEKNADVGGTWFENRYPGCRCDIPSHNYQFSWRTNPDWTSFYSDNYEIHAYFKSLCDEEKMWNSIRLSHIVKFAQWNEEEGLWHVKVKDMTTNNEFEDTCHFLLDGSGILNNWKWPSVPGLDKFRGELVHSANWPKAFEWHGKKVALIGNGSSGVQILPSIQPDVTKLFHFARSPTWIVPPGIDNMRQSTAGDLVSTLDMNGNRFTDAQIKRFKDDPEFYKRFVKSTEEVVNSKFNILVNDSPGAARAKKMFSAYMRNVLQGDQRLIDTLVPDFPVGCRRITPAVEYLKALHSDNVQVITEPIASIDEAGLYTSTGEYFEVDAIICATGFDVSFCPRFPIIGRKGNLQDIWRKQVPQAYMSCAVPDMPNYFVFLGPNAPIGHGSVLTITEHVAKYIVKMIAKCQTQGIKAVVPKQSVVNQFSEHIEKFMPRTAWAGNCRSWFKNGSATGPVTALHPGSRIHWFHMLEQFRGEDFDYTYHSRNVFHYLGNGYSIEESEGCNSTWYLDNPDAMF